MFLFSGFLWFSSGFLPVFLLRRDPVALIFPSKNNTNKERREGASEGLSEIDPGVPCAMYPTSYGHGDGVS